MWHIKKNTKAHYSFNNSTAAINLWTGSVRSGKTVAANVRWLNYVNNAPPGDLLMVAKTLDTLRRNILQPIEQMTDGEFTYSIGQRIARFCGRQIELVGANDERSENKIRGMTLAGAYGDEITLWTRNFWDMLHTRFSVKGAQFFGTTNPDSPLHWLKTDYIDNAQLKPEDLKVFHFTLDDNDTLEQAYVERLKRLYTGFYFDRFILGKWVVASGLVYDMFSERLIVEQAPFKPLAYYVGVDYGTQNACAFVLISTDYRRVHVQKLYYYSGRDSMQSKTNSEYLADLQRFCDGIPVSAVLVDPSAASFIEEIRRSGLPVRPADNSVNDGIRYVASLISSDVLTIDASCTELHEELLTYQWDDKAAMRGDEKPIKQNDHALDALRYGLYTMRWELAIV